nr:hypothetical protein SHINE37_44543 [Rhizobiaceae bacterium]
MRMKALHPASAALGAPTPRKRGEGDRRRRGKSLLPVHGEKVPAGG